MKRPLFLGEVAANFTAFTNIFLLLPQRRETTRDFVTAVAHSSDINGVSAAVNTVALKDIDVQMSALSGYETYV